MEDDGGIFNIDISSSEDGATNTKTSREFQSEADFQAVKTAWRPKIESGEIWKSLRLGRNSLLSKADSQMILHAVEELYFFRRYEEANRFAMEVLEGEVPTDLRKTLRDYHKRCEAKLDITANKEERNSGP